MKRPIFARPGLSLGLVYRTFRPEGEGLRILNLETNSSTKLTGGYDNFPAWSPRGDRIVFIRQVDGDYEVFSIRPDGKELRRLTNSPGNDAHPTFSPDGEWIIFSSSSMGFKDEALTRKPTTIRRAVPHAVRRILGTPTNGRSVVRSRSGVATGRKD